MIQYYPQLDDTANWPTLGPGDLIDVIAPAWKCQLHELQGAVRYLNSLGFEARVDRKIFASKVKAFAQTDAERFRQLKNALCASDSKAIWCVRGGYGALRLLPQLAQLKKPEVSKIFIGYSDITTLHTFLNGFWRWPTVHGPLLDRFGRQDHSRREHKDMLSILRGTTAAFEFRGLKPVNARARKKQTISSTVVGGNMAVLQSSLGTPWYAQPDGHIIFFEDTGERPHRLDRMLTQFLQAGFFKGARAVVFGSLLVGDAKDRRMIFQDVLPRFADSVSFPVLTHLPCGHGEKQNPLPFLTRATLHLGSRPQLVVQNHPSGAK